MVNARGAASLARWRCTDRRSKSTASAKSSSVQSHSRRSRWICDPTDSCAFAGRGTMGGFWRDAGFRSGGWWNSTSSKRLCTPESESEFPALSISSLMADQYSRHVNPAASNSVASTFRTTRAPRRSAWLRRYRSFPSGRCRASILASASHRILSASRCARSTRRRADTERRFCGSPGIRPGNGSSSIALLLLRPARRKGYDWLVEFQSKCPGLVPGFSFLE